MRPERTSSKRLGLDGAVETESLDALAVPAARLAVLDVVLRVIAVRLEVVDRRGGFTQAGDRRDHGASLANW